ncbi:MAG: FecR domain-containing protein [Bacteroidales bacterium]|nr:FecR domain-containing protein [Bacteroidales bacterium]
MKKQNLHIDDAFIIKVLSDQATEVERIQFDLWLKADPGNKETVNKIEKVLELLDKAKSTKRHQKNWKKIQQKIQDQYNTPAYITISQKSGNSISLLKMRWIKIAVSLLIILGIGFLFRYTINQNKNYTITSSDCISKPQILPDGSEITLNTGSSLSYTSHFNKKIREVTLTGEAFFAVASDKEKPFLIHTLITTTRVIGTAFNIKTDTLSKSVKLCVESGKVEFYNSDNPSHKVYLTKGEEGIFNIETQELKKREISDANYLAWKTGALEFDDTPLREVFTTIENHYHTNIISRDSLIEDLRLTSEYSNQTLEQVFNELKLLLDIDYKIINDTIYVK